VGSTGTGDTTGTSGITGTSVTTTGGTAITVGSGGYGGTGSSGGAAGSGAGGSGGRRDAGSTGGSGGQMTDARPDAVACDAVATIPVTFHMTAANGVDYCINNCASVWVSILPAGGGAPLSVSRGCTTTCSQCQPIACGAACIAPQHIKPEGETFTWDGTLWEPGKCGAQNASCVNQLCATPHGKYIARMCASRSTSDAGGFCMSVPEVTCVDVPFDYPTTSIVEGVLK
jgi:hypothetical protein